MPLFYDEEKSELDPALVEEHINEVEQYSQQLDANEQAAAAQAQPATAAAQAQPATPAAPKPAEGEGTNQLADTAHTIWEASRAGPQGLAG